MNYRKEIDGLRAVAVLPVILFHAGFGWFSGGFVGVDVFFVISGYLITSIILAEREAGSFSLIGFYERRARRILPALFVVMLACMPFAWLWMLSDQLRDFSQSLVAMSVFASNFLFSMESGYNDTAAELKPLLHTWSLAVEEQYYLLFPLFLMVFGKLEKRILFLILSLVLLFSLSVAQVGGNFSFSAPHLDEVWDWWNIPSWGFFLIPTRMWELLIGSLISFFHFGNKSNASNGSQWASLVGLLLIICSVFLFDKQTPFPSVYTLMPTLGTAMIILFGTPSTLVGRVLAHRGLVGIGLISYSAYLWHYPLFAFARIRSLNTPDTWVFAALAVAAIALAYPTWRYVERPFRDRTRISRRTIVASAALLSAAMIGAGLAGHINKGFAGRFDNVHRIDIEKKRQETWSVFLENSDLKDQLAIFPRHNIRRILIIGDSQSKDLFNALYLNKELFENQFEFRRLKFDVSCYERHLQVPDRHPCNAKTILDTRLFADADWIVVSTRWDLKAVNSFPPFAKLLTDRGKKVAVTTRPVEFVGGGSPAIIQKMSIIQSTKSFDQETLGKIFYRYRSADVEPVSAALRDVAKRHGFVFLDKSLYSCGESEKFCDALDENLRPLYFDYGHYTIEGARFFGKKIHSMRWLEPLLS